MATKTARPVNRKKQNEDPLRSAWHVLEEWMQLNGRRVGIFGLVVVGATALVGLLYYFTEYRHERAVAAYTEAYAKFTATVGAAPAAAQPALPGQPPRVTFPDEETKYRESAAAFETLAGDYGSMSDLGKYYAALSYLRFEPAKGVAYLEELAKGGSEVRDQARVALAEEYAKQGDAARAEETYAQIEQSPGAIPAQYVKTRLAEMKEKLNKPAEAAALYKQALDLDRDSPVGLEAEKGLQRVDPRMAAALPPKAPKSAGPMSPGGVRSHTQTSGAPAGMGF